MLLGSVHRRRAAARAWPATAMNATTCPTNRDVGSSQMSMCFVLVATPEIESSERVRLVKPARAVGEARRLDKHRDVTSPPMPTDQMSSFFVRITLRLSRAPRQDDRTDRQARRLQARVIRPLA